MSEKQKKKLGSAGEINIECSGAAPCCSLCGSCETSLFHADKSRPYFSCPVCKLVFVPEEYWLGPAEERAVYDLHQNDASQEGYRRFLSRLLVPLVEKLGPGRFQGLDFGCGPGPVLAEMLSEQGQDMKMYDPFYYPDCRVLSEEYDFICATEVVEHLRHPRREFDTLFISLKPGGWLGVMTKLVRSEAAFASWHYIRDPSHICFFSKAVFRYLAVKYNFYLEFAGDDVIMMMKRE